MSNRVKEFLEALLYAAVITAILFGVVFLVPSHGATSSKQRGSSLGDPVFFNNPFTYKAGHVIAVAYVSGDKGLDVRVQPIGTYSLFTEDILLCGSQVHKFMNVTNPMVLTYRTQAKRTLEGIGCHELISVDSLKPTKGELQ